MSQTSISRTVCPANFAPRQSDVAFPQHLNEARRRVICRALIRDFGHNGSDLRPCLPRQIGRHLSSHFMYMMYERRFSRRARSLSPNLARSSSVSVSIVWACLFCVCLLDFSEFGFEKWALFRGCVRHFYHSFGHGPIGRHCATAYFQRRLPNAPIILRRRTKAQTFPSRSVE